MKTPRLRVLRVITRLNIGGAALHVQLLTQKLDPALFQTTLAVGIPAADEGNMLELRGGEGLEPMILPHLKRAISLRDDLLALRALVRLMNRIRPHLVDTHLSKAGFLGRLAAQITRRPAVVHTHHIHVFSGYDISRAQRMAFLGMEKAAAKWSDRMICLTDELRGEIQSLGIGKPEQFRTIPLGFDLAPLLDDAQKPRARRKLRDELGLSPEAPIIGLVCRLAPIKSVEFFIEAAQIARKTRPDANFVVIGDGETRPALEKQAQTAGILNNGLFFLGFRSDMIELQHALDAMALTSLQEGTPVAIIEAMAAARPVVATDVGGVSKLVAHGQTGWLAPARDASKIAEGILKVLEEPETAKQWGEMGRAAIYPAFDVSRMLDETRALYLEILEEKGIVS